MEILLGIALLIVAVALVIWKKSSGTTAVDFIGTAGNSNTSNYSLANVPQRVARWAFTAKKSAKKYDVPWPVILAMIWQESSGNPGAVGANRDFGLMQVTPIAVADLRQNGYSVHADWKQNAETNIETGTAFLHLQLRRKNGNMPVALEAYNEGAYGASLDTGPDEYAVEVLNRAAKMGYGF